MVKCVRKRRLESCRSKHGFDGACRDGEDGRRSWTLGELPRGRDGGRLRRWGRLIVPTRCAEMLAGSRGDWRMGFFDTRSDLSRVEAVR